MTNDPGRYCIEIIDTETDESVLFADAEWTDEERNAALAQILRLAGPADDSWFKTDGEPKKGPPAND